MLILGALALKGNIMNTVNNGRSIKVTLSIFLSTTALLECKLLNTLAVIMHGDLLQGRYHLKYILFAHF